LPWPAPHLDPAAEVLDDLLDHGQAEARAALLGGKKRIENPRLEIRRDALPIVVNR